MENTRSKYKQLEFNDDAMFEEQRVYTHQSDNM